MLTHLIDQAHGAVTYRHGHFLGDFYGKRGRLWITPDAALDSVGLADDAPKARNQLALGLSASTGKNSALRESQTVMQNRAMQIGNASTSRGDPRCIDVADVGYRSVTAAINNRASAALLTVQTVRVVAELECAMFRDHPLHGLLGSERGRRPVDRRPKRNTARKAVIVATISAAETMPTTLAILLNVSEATMKRTVAGHSAQARLA